MAENVRSGLLDLINMGGNNIRPQAGGTITIIGDIQGRGSDRPVFNLDKSLTKSDLGRKLEARLPGTLSRFGNQTAQKLLLDLTQPEALHNTLLDIFSGH